MSDHKFNGKARSVPAGLLLAASVSLGIIFLLTAGLALCLSTERITWEQAGYWIMGMLFVSSYIGGKSAVYVTKRPRIPIALMSGALLWGSLLCVTALYFGGDYCAVWETGAIIAAGSGASALVSMPARRKTRHKTGRHYC